MSGWADSIFSNLPPGRPLPGSPKRPKLPANTPLMPVDPREVVGGLADQATEGVGHAIGSIAGQPFPALAPNFGLPNADAFGRDITSMLQEPIHGGASPSAAMHTMLAAAPLAATTAKVGRTAEEIATGTKAATEDAGAAAGPLARTARAAPQADAAAQAQRAAQASPGQAALDRMTGAAPAAAPSITAYHGSPHSFDRFDISKIGTGEGAQAYGHGLYFAGNEDVAKNYRNQLAPGFVNADGSPLSDAAYSALAFVQPKYEQSGQLAEGIQDAIGRLKNQSEFYRKNYGSGVNLYDNAVDTLQNMDPATLKPKGHMYQVGINADPDHFLDWDKPFEQQSPTVQKAVNDLWTARGGSLEGRDNPPFVASSSGNRGESIHAAIATTYGGAGKDADAQAAASQALADAGVPGIKYLDQGSRGAGGEGGTQNYVTFSDDMINILKKYGLAGLGLTAGAGALSASGQSPVSSPAQAAPPPQGMTLGAQSGWPPQ